MTVVTGKEVEGEDYGPSEDYPSI